MCVCACVAHVFVHVGRARFINFVSDMFPMQCHIYLQIDLYHLMSVDNCIENCFSPYDHL